MQVNEEKNLSNDAGQVSASRAGAASEWTVASVKAELPNVRVKVGKRNIVDGRVSGRLNQFATVSVTNNFPRSGVPLFYDWQFAWETIANALNSGRPLIV